MGPLEPRLFTGEEVRLLPADMRPCSSFGLWHLEGHVLPTVVTAVDAAAEGGASWGRTRSPCWVSEARRAGTPGMGHLPSGPAAPSAAGRNHLREVECTPHTQRGPGQSWCPQAHSREPQALPHPRAWADPGNKPSRGGEAAGGRHHTRTQGRSSLVLPCHTHKPPALPRLAKSHSAGHRIGFQGLGANPGQAGRGTGFDQQDTGHRSQPGDGILPLHPRWTALKLGFPPHTSRGHSRTTCTPRALRPCPSAPRLLAWNLLLWAHLGSPVFLWES